MVLELSRWTVIAALALVWIFAGGCATTSNSVSGEWQAPRARLQPFDAVLVVAIAPNDQARRAFEQTLADAIAASGDARGLPSYALAAQMGSSELSRDMVVAMADKFNCDAVLVTRILEQAADADTSPEQAVVHVGPTVQVSQNEDASMTAVMVSNYSVEIVPGNLILKTDTVLESSVYEPKTGDQLVYRARTNARFDLGPEAPIEMAAAGFAQAIAKRLRSDGVIH